LDGSPADDVLEGTYRVWFETMGRFHPEQLDYAFDLVERTVKRWPAPAQVIELAGQYRPVAPRRERLKPPDDPEAAARIKALLDGLADRLRVTK
jgi:hypothetical protein